MGARAGKEVGFVLNAVGSQGGVKTASLFRFASRPLVLWKSPLEPTVKDLIPSH